jgi:hypothetical protein
MNDEETKRLMHSGELHQPFRAGDGIRTRELLLGKETLYHSATPA